jgi:PAS domain S-box-containing protein
MQLNLEHFSEELIALQVRWSTLSKQLEKNPDQPSHLLRECLEEMGIALEELHVAEEELIVRTNEVLQINEALTEQMRRYQDLFNFAPDGYLETDMSGKILEANYYAGRLFGLDVQILRGTHITNVIDPELRRAVRLRINQMPELRRVQHWEVRCQYRSSQLFDAMLTVEVISDSKGDGQALRWLIRDITDLKKAQAELEQAKLQNMELLESDRLKQRFLANVSHELRTPLNSIVGFSSLLQQHMSDGPNAKYGEWAGRIHRNGQNLLLMIQELLDFAEFQGSLAALKPKTFDLCPLIHETLEELGCLADQKSLTLKTNMPETFEVFNDPKRLRQVLVNLVNNAIKFTNHGSVTVKLQRENDDYFVLMVQDTGVGIAPEDQANVFKEFWQVQEHRDHKSSGTGLGLAIVHSIVQSMGGEVTLSSQPRLGTTFRICLPCQISVPVS